MQDQLDMRLPLPSVTKRRPDGAHDPKLHMLHLTLYDFRRRAVRRLSGFIDPGQMRAHGLAKRGQRYAATIASEQRPSQLGLEFLDRHRERRLRGRAGFGGAGEIHMITSREKIPNLMKFHSISTF